MDFKCSCPQLFSCYQKYFVGFISVLKNVKFCLCWWPDTSVPDAIACLSLSLYGLSMMPPSLYLSSSMRLDPAGTSPPRVAEYRTIQPRVRVKTTLGQKPILVSHRSPTQMNQISVFQRRQEWIVSPVFSRKVTHSCVMISS